MAGGTGRSLPAAHLHFQDQERGAPCGGQRMSNATVKVQCRQCGGTTNHGVLYDHASTWWLGEPGEGYQCEDNHQVLQCNGCGTICFRHLSETPAQELPEESVYPPIPRPSRWPGLSGWALPEKVLAIYGETVIAFQAEA